MSALVLSATLIAGLTIQPLDRRALLHGVSRASATAAAVAILPPVIAEEQFVAKRARDATELKGSGGLSSYNELKLTNALKELAGAPVAAEIKPSVDVISSALPLITQNKVPDGAKISQASAALANLVLTEDLQTQAASLVKKSADIRAAIVKADANAAAIAATAFVSSPIFAIVTKGLRSHWPSCAWARPPSSTPSARRSTFPCREGPSDARAEHDDAARWHDKRHMDNWTWTYINGSWINGSW